LQLAHRLAESLDKSTFSSAAEQYKIVLLPALERFVMKEFPKK
jgi:hypothetical protein